MSKFRLIRDIMSIKSLDELEEYLKSRPEDDLRAALFQQLDGLLEYDEADQWTTAVRLCECLAILGWGNRERVDVVSHFNGDSWETRFVNEKCEDRFRMGRWRKRKAGWVLVNPRHRFSPDQPDKPDQDWRAHSRTDFPVIDRPNLPSQRNYQKQMPIIMGEFGGLNKTSNDVSAMKQQLTGHLRDAMRPECYGDALEYFYLTLHCPALSDSPRPSLKVGAYDKKQRAFYSDLFFDDAYGDRSAQEQREYFANNLLAAIDALETKLRKRKIQYNIQSFRADVLNAIDNWHDKQGT